MFDFSWLGSISFDGFLPAVLGSTRYDFGWLGGSPSTTRSCPRC